MQALTVSLDAEGMVHFGGSVISDEELLQRLRDNAMGAEPRSVVIRADQSVELARVVSVLDIVRGSGAAQVSLAARRSEAGL
jgi:biopolymer transport protein ExbD